MSEDTRLPERFFIIRTRVRPEDEFTYGPMMQKVADGKSALLTWDTEEAARGFLQTTLSDRQGEFVVVEADVTYYRELQDNYRASGRKLGMLRVTDEPPAGAVPERD